MKYPLATLLQVANIARSTFYYYADQQSKPDVYAAIKDKILKVYHQHKGRYGYRRITSALRSQDLRINHKKVQRIMQIMGLKSLVRPKKYRSYRGQEGRIAANILQRDFTEIGRAHV